MLVPSVRQKKAYRRPYTQNCNSYKHPSRRLLIEWFLENLQPEIEQRQHTLLKDFLEKKQEL